MAVDEGWRGGYEPQGDKGRLHLISAKKWKALGARLQRFGIYETALEEQFIRSSGPGGQKVNKASSAVWLAHRPSGIQLKCQISRSQADNRFFARRILADKIEAKALGEKNEERKRIEKIRRQKRRRSKRAKEKLLRDKRHRSANLAQRRVSEN